MKAQVKGRVRTAEPLRYVPIAAIQRDDLTGFQIDLIQNETILAAFVLADQNLGGPSFKLAMKNRQPLCLRRQINGWFQRRLAVGQKNVYDTAPVDHGREKKMPAVPSPLEPLHISSATGLDQRCPLLQQSSGEQI
jgi:hypothetical protein